MARQSPGEIALEARLAARIAGLEQLFGSRCESLEMKVAAHEKRLEILAEAVSKSELEARLSARLDAVEQLSEASRAELESKIEAFATGLSDSTLDARISGHIAEVEQQYSQIKAETTPRLDTLEYRFRELSKLLERRTSDFIANAKGASSSIKSELSESQPKFFIQHQILPTSQVGNACGSRSKSEPVHARMWPASGSAARREAQKSSEQRRPEQQRQPQFKWGSAPDWPTAGVRSRSGSSRSHRSVHFAPSSQVQYSSPAPQGPEPPSPLRTRPPPSTPPQQLRPASIFASAAAAAASEHMPPFQRSVITPFDCASGQARKTSPAVLSRGCSGPAFRFVQYPSVSSASSQSAGRSFSRENSFLTETPPTSNPVQLLERV